MSKVWFAIDSSREELLCGITNSVTRTNGAATVKFTSGEQIFSHKFYLDTLGSQKVIIGNGMLIAQDGIIEPGRESIVLKEKKIYCRHVASKPAHDRIRLYSDVLEQLKHVFFRFDWSNIIFRIQCREIGTCKKTNLHWSAM